MAQQFVTNPIAPSAQDNLDLLYTNLAENVAYRRAKQQMKAAQKQDLELKMAQGLIPKANITVTDEGFAFEGEDTLGSELLGTERKDTSAAREAFWKAVGAPEPSEDMTRQGFTNVLEEQIPGQQEAFAAMVEQARRAADETLSPEERSLAQQNYANASAMLGSVANRPPLINETSNGIPTIPLPNTLPTQTQTETQTLTPQLTPTSTAQIGATIGGVGATTSTPPPPPPSAASLGSMMARRLAKNVPLPATPVAAKPTTAKNAKAAAKDKAADKESTSQKLQQSGGISEMGQVEVGMKRGGFDVQMANVATKTTQVQSAQIDEIKRSIPRLAGLAALENYGNQLMQARGYNTGAPMQDTFSSLLNQRVKDIARWEAAATTSGTSRTLEKLDPFKMEVKPTELDLKVTRKDQLAAKNIITLSNKTQGPAATVNPGVYQYPSATDPTKMQTVEADPYGNLMRPAADIPYEKGPVQFKDGPTFFTQLKTEVATNPIAGLSGWKVEGQFLDPKQPNNPSRIVLKSPDGKQNIYWNWVEKDKRWRLGASLNTNIGAIQEFAQASFVRRGS